LNGWDIPFVSHVEYLGVIFAKITLRLHKDMIEGKTFRTFGRIYSILKSEHLNADIKLTVPMALIRSVRTYACPAWELAADTSLKIAAHAKQGSEYNWVFSKVHTAFNLLYVMVIQYKKLCRQQAEVI
jgi:hypothetical protein